MPPPRVGVIFIGVRTNAGCWALLTVNGVRIEGVPVAGAGVPETLLAVEGLPPPATGGVAAGAPSCLFWISMAAARYSFGCSISLSGRSPCRPSNVRSHATWKWPSFASLRTSDIFLQANGRCWQHSVPQIGRLSRTDRQSNKKIEKKTVRSECPQPATYADKSWQICSGNLHFALGEQFSP